MSSRKQQHEREEHPARSKKPEPEPSPRPKSAKYRQREPAPPPHKPTVINVPEPRTDREDVAVNEGTQTADTVGIQTEKRLLEEYDHVSYSLPFFYLWYQNVIIFQTVVMGQPART